MSNIKLEQVNIGAIIKFENKDKVMLVSSIDYDGIGAKLLIVGYYEIEDRTTCDISKTYHVDNIILPDNRMKIYDKYFDISFKSSEDIDDINSTVELIGFVDKSVLIDLVDKKYRMEYDQRMKFLEEYTPNNFYIPIPGEVYNFPYVGKPWIFIVSKIEKNPESMTVIDVKGFDYNHDLGLFIYRSLPLARWWWKSSKTKIKDRVIYNIPDPEYLLSFNYSPYTGSKSFRLNGIPNILPQDLIDKINDIIKSNE